MGYFLIVSFGILALSSEACRAGCYWRQDTGADVLMIWCSNSYVQKGFVTFSLAVKPFLTLAEVSGREFVADNHFLATGCFLNIDGPVFYSCC